MKPKKTGIDPLAFVSPKAKVAENVYIGAFAYISDGAEVGEGSQIYPHAYIGEGVKIGKNALIYRYCMTESVLCWPSKTSYLTFPTLTQYITFSGKPFSTVWITASACSLL